MSKNNDVKKLLKFTKYCRKIYGGRCMSDTTLITAISDYLDADFEKVSKKFNKVFDVPELDEKTKVELKKSNKVG